MGKERLRLNSLKVACRRGRPPGEQADKRRRPSQLEFFDELESIASDPQTSIQGRARIWSELAWLRSPPRSDVTDPRDVLKEMLLSHDPEAVSEAQCRIIDHIEQSDPVNDREASGRNDQLTRQFSPASVNPKLADDAFTPGLLDLETTDHNEDQWVRVPRVDWHQDAAYSEKPPPFLRPVAAARLAAIATLRKTAAEAVQSARPQTPDELEQRLAPAFEEYTNHLFDKLADAKLKTAVPPSRRSKAYATWLKSKCLPAVIDDVCKPIFGQFSITLRYIAELLPDVSWPEEVARVRRTLWKVCAEEVIPSAFTDRIKNRLSISLLGQRIPYWEAQAMEFVRSQTSESKARNQDTGRGGKGDIPLLKKADGAFNQTNRGTAAGRPRAVEIHGEKVQDLRGDNSQETFARLTKLSPDVIQRAEAGEATTRTMGKLLRFAKSRGLKLSKEDLKKNSPAKAAKI